MERVSISGTATLIKYLFLVFAISVCTIIATAAAKESVRREARWRGWNYEGTAQGKSYELMIAENGRPIYYITCNADAAMSTGASILHGSPYLLDGDGLTVGIWDAGWVRFMHQEFDNDRVTVIDSDTAMDCNSIFDDHATHVAGTIGASGDPCDAAKGMAPAVNIDSYDWNGDVSEMDSVAADVVGDDDKIYLSNHSYGVIAGWEFGSFKTIPGDLNGDDKVNFEDFAIFAQFWFEDEQSLDIAPLPNGDGIVGFLDLVVLVEHWLETIVTAEGPYWFGVWGECEDRNFGRYGSYAANWDSVCYSAPYYLPFKAAGNDRDDMAPSDGTDFWYLDPNNGEWRLKPYDGENDPCDDDWDDSGYDTIPIVGTAKNIMTVGAVDDDNDMTDFSGWGPTDDGRIKPDIVANGFELYSPIGVNDVNYATYSGTGMASACAAGSATLLVEYYNELFPGEAMWASTLKGLIIHTATDLGNPGPDYMYGWGLMDVNDGANYIKEDFEDPNKEKIIEGVLTTGTSNTYTFTFDGGRPIWATLCWTDPPAEAIDELDSNSPRLVNDLDLRIIIDPNDPNTFYYPYILDPKNPDEPAITGYNRLDNVEQVYIESPIAATYTVEISHSGTLTKCLQYYSLILSEPRPITGIFVDDDAASDPGPGNPNVSDPDEDGSSEHPFDSIQKAVDDANDGVTIFVRDGTYTGVGNYNIDTNGKAVKVRSEAGPEDCIIDCESNGRAFVFQSGESATTVLDGFTIINGYAEDTDWPQEPDVDPSGYGGAIYCKNSSPMISNCVITENAADSGGGAIFCDENSSVLISGCEISWNECGAILYEHDINDFKDVNLPGGGIYCKSASPAITNCLISDNWSVGSGGGIACEDSNAAITHCDIIDNTCWATNSETYQAGGGIYCSDSNQIIFHCFIKGNISRKSGGGIAVRESEVWIGSCGITDNICLARGGGIYGEGDDSKMTITNCLITENIGYYSGGISSDCGSFAEIKNCTIANNAASWDVLPWYSGGLCCFDGNANVTNSILWYNTGWQIASVDVNDVAVTYSDIQMFDSNGLSDPASIWLGQGNINEEPLFAKQRFDYHLKTEWPNGRWNPETEEFDLTDASTSLCINAGAPNSDYSFEPEENGGRINMGAYGNTTQASKSD